MLRVTFTDITHEFDVPFIKFQMGATTFESGHTNYCKYVNLLCVQMGRAWHAVYTSMAHDCGGVYVDGVMKMTPILTINW